ncbi:MAG: preprotein translocase subunit YajC [Alphaproteobacteria bacterium]
MPDITSLFISQALAQTPNMPPGGSGTSVFMNFLPLVLIFAVFYVLIIRPQQKKMDEQARMIKALQRGDRVITTGGIHGKIVRLEGDDNLILEIADNVNIKVLRSHVGNLAAKTQPVNAPDGDESEKKN